MIVKNFAWEDQSQKQFYNVNNYYNTVRCEQCYMKVVIEPETCEQCYMKQL